MEAEAAEYCARHPDVETGLRCGSCDELICPRCMVQTPVGARCPSCARLRVAPVFDVGLRHYALAFATSLSLGAALGVAWWWVLPFRLGLFFGVILGLGMGWLTFNAVERATGYKRGVPIQVAIASGPVLAYFVRNVLEGDALLPSGDLGGLAAIGVAIVFGVSQVRVR